MPSKRDFLVEIGTEELPPKSLSAMAAAFAASIDKGLTSAGLSHGTVQWFATPRRLAARVLRLIDRQPDQVIRRQGPSITASFDASGQPTRAALGFAASCGVNLDQLGQVDGPKGKVLQYEGVKAGEQTTGLLPAIVQRALDELPIARRMRWGAGSVEFVRPVHWVVLLHGSDVVDAELLGIRSGKRSRGHRHHAPRDIVIGSPSRYEALLETKGRVLVDFALRRERIRSGVQAAAESVGGVAVVAEALLDEVTSLVEWPVPLVGQFDARFLALPAEVPIATMQDHQRYFPVRDADGRLMNHFVTVANIESREPQKVREGNERVIRPRLSDAAFFWEVDRKQPLSARVEALKAVTYQQRLGSMFEKTQRVRTLAAQVAPTLGATVQLVERAAELSKCDLLTALVGEFPELQGLMGKYYATADGEPDEVAVALEEQYCPRFAGDRLPSTPVGQALAIADKLDTIAGTFAIGQKPTGTRDPFGLRRSALGVLRLCLEQQLELDLHALIKTAVHLQPVVAPNAVDEVIDYFAERLRAFYLEDARERTVTPEMFDAVLAKRPGSPLDFAARLQALENFVRLPDAQALAAANKRIANILRKTQLDAEAELDEAMLREPAEQRLLGALKQAETQTRPRIQARDYTGALTQMAQLRAPVDEFFDQVLVMADDVAVRVSRLSLLQRLRELFGAVADLSRLPG
jgi:glycyl-tRNA synthetase beta chain